MTSPTSQDRVRKLRVQRNQSHRRSALAQKKEELRSATSARIRPDDSLRETNDENSTCRACVEHDSPTDESVQNPLQMGSSGRDHCGDEEDARQQHSTADEDDETIVAATEVDLERIENEVRDRMIEQVMRASDVSKPPEDTAQQRRRTILLVMIGLVFLVTGTIVALIGSLATGTKASAAPTISPTSFEDVRSAMGEDDLLLFETLVEISVELDGGSTLQNVSSPQFQAFRSMLTLDVSTLTADELRTRYGLAVLYYATGGDGWKNNEGWLNWESSYCDDWFWSEDCDLCSGLCDDWGQLRSIRLAGNNLQGFLPSEISFIAPRNMVYFAVNDNANLAGTLPESMINSFPDLLQLRLHSTSISGPIPSILGQLTSLSILDLGSTKLTGSIPTELGRLTRLEDLSLSKIPSLGPTTIPSEIYSLLRLRSLKMDESRLLGTLSPRIGDLTRLDGVSLSQNSLTGSIPAEIGFLDSIEELQLDYNNFSGSIPSTIGHLVEAIELSLQHNELTGEIPHSLSNMTSLEDFRSGGNQLTGSIPSGIERMVALTSLHLGHNKMTGSVPFDGLAQLGNLESLELNNNLFTGLFDPSSSFWQLSELRTVLLNHNHLMGTLMNSIGTSQKLRELNLSSNTLTGSIPTGIGTATALRILDLSNNTLSSSLPRELGGLTALTALRLENNEFISGTVPAVLGNLDALRTANLSGTNIVGDAPFCQTETLSIPCDTMSCQCCETTTFEGTLECAT